MDDLRHPPSWAGFQRHIDGPAWRWELARREALRETSGPLADQDPVVRLARDYLRVSDQGECGPPRAAQWFPEVHAALAAWGNARFQAALKILVLGDCPAADIARQLGVAETVVDVLEKLLFDVRPALAAPSWICNFAIVPEETAGRIDLAARLRLAFFGGRVMAQAVVDADQRLPLAAADRFFDQALLLQEKLRAALAVPLIAPPDVLRYLKLHLAYQIQSRRLDFAIEKFRARVARTAALSAPTPQAPAEPAATVGDHPVPNASPLGRSAAERTSESEVAPDVMACRVA